MDRSLQVLCIQFIYAELSSLKAMTSIPVELSVRFISHSVFRTVLVLDFGLLVQLISILRPEINSKVRLSFLAIPQLDLRPHGQCWPAL